ncbi:MAG TPA: DUF3303 family protein [Blastocatellia bacterium]|nr:DUF3303 family protein [Blastocatellia bacterium]
MVIEQFRNDDPGPVGERFKQLGRMLPEKVVYHASWLEPTGARCFQLMEASDRGLIEAWTRRWDDLASFEIIPVLTSADFWGKREVLSSEF